MDKILLNKLEFYGYHGLLPEEKKLGQRFYVDAELYAELRKAGRTDDMNDSIHYGAAYDIIEEVVTGEAKNLIEAVAETIAERLLSHFSLLTACKVKVTKPDPPIAGNYQSVAVEIYREKSV
ncbi:dihydroneopterin aldolase [Virgibacillus sp. YIM 98842]|jgi:dihydroneopterin aldolase|uniref:dihydroneopterin aldolase n=1 Tax=Virgibacillus sp. YIM 98842 TaxID=2663533 RepID=UPI0013D949A4|nr:dihydroneopterin aldolase [Virgibacillus sp. YIM 98842]